MNSIGPYIHYFISIRDKIIKIIYKYKEKIIVSISLQAFDKLNKKIMVLILMVFLKRNLYCC